MKKCGMTLAEAITVVLQQRGQKQVQMARQAGISESTLSLLKRGQRGQFSALLRLMRAYPELAEMLFGEVVKQS